MGYDNMFSTSRARIPCWLFSWPFPTVWVGKLSWPHWSAWALVGCLSLGWSLRNYGQTVDQVKYGVWAHDSHYYCYFLVEIAIWRGIPDPVKWADVFLVGLLGMELRRTNQILNPQESKTKTISRESVTLFHSRFLKSHEVTSSILGTILLMRFANNPFPEAAFCSIASCILYGLPRIIYIYN